MNIPTISRKDLPCNLRIYVLLFQLQVVRSRLTRNSTGGSELSEHELSSRQSKSNEFRDLSAPGFVVPSSSDISVDHNYAVMTSPRTLKLQLLNASDRAEKCRRKLHVVQEQSRRLKRKVDNMTCVLDDLKQKQLGLVSESCDELLRSNFSGIPLGMINRAR